MRDADSWGLAFIVFGTIAIVWSLPAQPKRNFDLAAKRPAVSAPAAEVAYKITVSAQRVPGECKTLTADSSSDLIATCQSIATRETQMTMVPVDEKVQVATKP